MNSLRAISSGLAAVLTIALAVGCASSEPKVSETAKAVESLSNMKASVANAQAEVDRVMSSMNAIASGNDLPNAYKSFNSAVAEMRQSATRAGERAASMRDKADDYITKWQKEMGTAEGSAEKAALEQRKAAVRTNFMSARNAGQSVRQAYGPLNAKLSDIQQSLSGNNLTPQGVSQVRPIIDQARHEAQNLKNNLAAFSAELNRMQSGLMQTGAPAK